MRILQQIDEDIKKRTKICSIFIFLIFGMIIFGCLFGNQVRKPMSVDEACYYSGLVHENITDLGVASSNDKGAEAELISIDEDSVTENYLQYITQSTDLLAKDSFDTEKRTNLELFNVSSYRYEIIKEINASNYQYFEVLINNKAKVYFIRMDNIFINCVTSIKHDEKFRSFLHNIKAIDFFIKTKNENN